VLFRSTAIKHPSSRVRPGLLAAPYREDAPLSHAPTLVAPVINYPPWQPDLWCSVSDPGTLAYVPADVRAKSLVLVDRTGRIELFSDQPGTYSSVRISRTTSRVVASADAYAWLYAPDGSARERLAHENRDWDEGGPVWAPDGKAVVYSSNESGNWDIYRRLLGASKSEVLLAKERDQSHATTSPDGMIAYAEVHPTTGYDIWLLDPNGKARPWLVSPRNETPSRFSPDGAWLAYCSDESGRFEIYVKPVAGEAARVQVSTAGASNSAWSPKGNMLYYREAGAMWAVDLGRGDVPVPGPRRKLFDVGWALNPFGEWDYSGFDVMPDGERFLMVRREPKAIPDRINVVVNWYDELRRLVPLK
jgi:dipeptidyl aminopeptidase/acylaminoacyl peptidase